MDVLQKIHMHTCVRTWREAKSTNNDFSYCAIMWNGKQMCQEKQWVWTYVQDALALMSHVANALGAKAGKNHEVALS